MALKWLLVFARCIFDSLAWIIELFVPTQRKRLPPIKDALLLKSASEIASLIKSRKVSCEQVITAYIDRIKEWWVARYFVIDIACICTISVFIWYFFLKLASHWLMLWWTTGLQMLLRKPRRLTVLSSRGNKCKVHWLECPSPAKIPTVWKDSLGQRVSSPRGSDIILT